MISNKTPYFISITAKMMELLHSYDIPFTVGPCFDGFQFRFPWTEGDCIIHSFSHSHNHGYIETYNFIWDDDNISIWKIEEIIPLLYALYNHKNIENELNKIKLHRLYNN